MLKNYILVTLRNLLRNKVFTIINIIGLGIALSLCIVAWFNHMFNYEFDRTHENFKTIYRVNGFRDMQGREQEYGAVPATLGLEIKKDIPGVERSARIMRTGSPVRLGDDIFPAQISYIDPEFLDIFTFPLLYGDKNSIKSQGNVLLSEKMAKTLFGSEYPVGKMISIVNDQNREFTYSVSAVFKDLPENSSFRIDILSNFDNFLSMWNVNDSNWKMMTTALFVQIPDKSLLSSVTEKLKDYLAVQNDAREDFKINRFTLVPLDKVGENSRNIWNSGLFPSLHPAQLVAPPVMAIFILIIACLNFANTSIATFSRRQREIGLRRTFGGQRRQLISQFMLETYLICFLALLAGIALASVLVPAYSNLWSYMSITLSYTRYLIFWAFLVILLLVTGFAAGVYPALHVSSFSPVNIIKGTTVFQSRGILSISMLTLQFAISVASLVLGITFARNAVYQRTLDLGYDRDKVIVVPVTGDIYSSLRNEILSNPQVISAGGTMNHIGYGTYHRPVKDADKQLEVGVLDIGPEYAQTMGLRLVEGRLFDTDRASADRANNSIIINQKMVGDFGWQSGIGKTITMYDTTKLNVIGVIKDFYQSGLWEEIEPVMLRLSSDEKYYTLAVRVNSENIPSVLDFIGRKWKTLGTNLIFGGRPQEDLMKEEKDVNSGITKINIFLAVVAMILSLIGMYNMVSLDIIKRTREVGIRKIQGASVMRIILLLSRKFIVVLLIASAMGCLAGYYLSTMLMDSIWDYFVSVRGYTLLLAVAIITVSTALTLTFIIIRAARRNPAESLKYE
jgi:ABC-type antimicrobial peptide transport system permease subunit